MTDVRLLSPAALVDIVLRLEDECDELTRALQFAMRHYASSGYWHADPGYQLPPRPKRPVIDEIHDEP